MISSYFTKCDWKIKTYELHCNVIPLKCYLRGVYYISDVKAFNRNLLKDIQQQQQPKKPFVLTYMMQQCWSKEQ